ncbi:stage II sporulation protein R [Inconstantimicrobium mannanitabidum]|uniref:Stage II sporulation protein R n=1 Tax=Inconstantimicrobium mannanitabidum TaxID=1604901 RepID=A0ACB5R7I8_9CLOT|nr:stage II sporulation protein R [Clostridium sp. TW13]GKX64921.1 stage II sporulation protein R [Clostridium sp. TW13]
MKRKFFVLIMISFIILVVMVVTSSNGFENLNKIKVYSDTEATDLSNEISGKLIRFHVIANSDTKEDQSLKLKVRDEILKYISPKLKNSSSIEESRKILKDNDNEIKKIAVNCIKSNGYNYTVKSTLGHENFPVKTYGNITLPQGNYEAYRVIIGSGKGQNWWCVMFPPLCFIDITKGQVSYDKTENEMKKVLNDKEYDEIDNRKEQTHIEYKFKIKEIFDKIVDFISN